MIKLVKLNESVAMNESLDIEDMRDEIYNSWSYGWKGTPSEQNNSKRSEENDIFDKYDIQYEDQIFDLPDSEVKSMYKELENLYESVKINRAKKIMN